MREWFARRAAVVNVDGVGVVLGGAGAPQAAHAVLAGVAANAGAEGVVAAGLGGGHLGVASVAAFRGDLLDTRDHRVTFRVLAVLAVMGFLHVAGLC